jgi:predicted DNA-binding protein (MmcQ/YjbR family)
MTRQDLIDYCLSFPSAYEDYPFDDMTDGNSWAVMRHKVNKKSFALIYERGRKLCVNLKCEPLEAEFLRNVYKDVTPAYHMNKTHWNTVTTNGDVPIEELKRQIEHSYDLIKPKTRRYTYAKR